MSSLSTGKQVTGIKCCPFQHHRQMIISGCSLPSLPRSALSDAMKASAHPLDPLSAAEIQAAGVACRAYAKEKGNGTPFFHALTLQVIGLQFPGYMLWVDLSRPTPVEQEPAKKNLLAYEAGSSKPCCRQALSIFSFPGSVQPFEAVVDLQHNCVASCRRVSHDPCEH